MFGHHVSTVDRGDGWKAAHMVVKDELSVSNALHPCRQAVPV